MKLWNKQKPERRWYSRVIKFNRKCYQISKDERKKWLVQSVKIANFEKAKKNSTKHFFICFSTKWIPNSTLIHGWWKYPIQRGNRSIKWVSVSDAFFYWTFYLFIFPRSFNQNNQIHSFLYALTFIRNLIRLRCVCIKIKNSMWWQ